MEELQTGYLIIKVLYDPETASLDELSSHADDSVDHDAIFETEIVATEDEFPG
jgi:hypothetical protein